MNIRLRPNPALARFGNANPAPAGFGNANPAPAGFEKPESGTALVASSAHTCTQNASTSMGKPATLPRLLVTQEKASDSLLYWA